MYTTIKVNKEKKSPNNDTKGLRMSDFYFVNLPLLCLSGVAVALPDSLTCVSPLPKYSHLLHKLE